MEQKGYRAEVLIQHPRMDVKATLHISAGHNPPLHVANYGDTATLVISTGACNVQLYATAATLRDLAHHLTAAAIELDDARRAAA